MASKYDKMFPTRKQNQETAQKAAESHRDILFSQRNVFGKRTAKLTDAYLTRKRRKKMTAAPASPNANMTFGHQHTRLVPSSNAAKEKFGRASKKILKPLNFLRTQNTRIC